MARGWEERGPANEGFVQLGGVINASGVAVGRGAHVSVASALEPAAASARHLDAARRSVGVITVLGAEMHAVAEVMKEFDGYAVQVRPEGLRFHTAVAVTGTGPLSIVAVQTAEPGQRSVILAFQALQSVFDPEFVVLVGIAGGVHRDVRPGDVVLASEAVFYDARKEIAGTTLRRGRSFPVPTVLQHAVNAFAADLQQPVVTTRGAAGFRVHVGPIGTGEAVVADANSAIRHYLHQYSDKVLAVETEAGGLAQAFHETAGTNSGCRGWLAVRGIADLADAVKNDEFHRLASHNAATVLSALLPYLRSAGRR